MNILSILGWKEVINIAEAVVHPGVVILNVHSIATHGCCPVCQQTSSRIHSRYCRHIADLSWAAKPVVILLSVRRFRCDNPNCKRKIFSERFASVPAYARRTIRMQHQLAQIGFQLGGQAGARLATLLGMPVSDTTLIRILADTDNKSISTPKVLGVDDWAIKKGKSYGTILVDMEKRQPIELLPDREADSLANWHKAHPGVEIISRDRASSYADGARKGAPNAMQIADRWHLMKNLGEALKRMLEKLTPQLRIAAKILATQQQQQKYEALQSTDIIGPTVSLSSPTAQRALLFQEVKTLLQEGVSIRGIARRLKINKKTVVRYRSLDHYPAKTRPKSQQSTVLPYKAYLSKRWGEGERNIKQLWREISSQGYSGSAGSVYRFFEDLPKEAETLPLPELEIKNWTPTKVQFLLGKWKADLSPEEKNFLNVFFQHCPQAKLARKLALKFRVIFERKNAQALPEWIHQAKSSGIAALKNFATGLESDFEAVKAAATYHWSNGQVEGQVNRLKLIKRQMYGRAGFGLLRKRVVKYADSG